MRLRTLALGAIMSAGGGAAFAQAPQLPQVASERQWKVDLRLGATYDTNIARTGKAVAAVRGVVQEDTTVTPQVSANIVQTIGQSAVFLDGQAGYDFHVRNEILDRRRIAVNYGATGQVGICRPMLYGTFRQFQSDLADLNLVTTENLQTTTGVTGGLQCGRNTGPGFSLTGQRQDVKNSEDTLVIQDYTTETLFVGLNYNAPSLVNASIFYTYTNNEYPNRINPGRPVGDGFFTEAVGLQLQRDIGSRLQVSGAVSATRVKREFAPPPSKAKFEATTYQFDGTYRAGNRITVHLLGARNVKPSDRPGKLFDVAEQLEGNIRYRLNARFGVTVGHTYQDMQSNVDTLQVARVVTSSITNTTYGTFEVRRVGNGSVTFDVRHERRDTNLPTFNYTSTRVGLTAAYSF
jgi:hypothetical protein